MTATEPEPEAAAAVRITVHTGGALPATNTHVLVTSLLRVIAVAKVLADCTVEGSFRDVDARHAAVYVKPFDAAFDDRTTVVDLGAPPRPPRDLPHGRWQQVVWDKAVDTVSDAGLVVARLSYRNPAEVAAIIEGGLQAAASTSRILDFLLSPRSRLRKVRAEADLYEAAADHERAQARLTNAQARLLEFQYATSRQQLPLPLGHRESGAALDARVLHQAATDDLAELTNVPREGVGAMLDNAQTLQAVEVFSLTPEARVEVVPPGEVTEWVQPG